MDLCFYVKSQSSVFIGFRVWMRLLITVFVFIVSICCIMPNFFDDFEFMKDNKVSLGLDLKGGSHVVFQVDFDSYTEDKVSELYNELLALKELQITGISRTDNILHLHSMDTDNAYKMILKQYSDQLNMVSSEEQTLDISYSIRFIKEMQEHVLQDSIARILRRIDSIGTRDAVVHSQGNDKIIVQIPGVYDVAKVKEIIGTTAKLSFHFVTDRGGYSVRDSQGNVYMLKKIPEFTGDVISYASSGFSKSGAPIVLFKMNTAGAKKLARITRDNIGMPLAIVLDNTVLTAPVIRDAILDGQGEITGDFDIQYAEDLSILLRSGALPASLVLIEEKIIGPTLGQESVVAGLKAALLAFALVSGFLICFYKIRGVFSVLTLLYNFLVIFALMSVFRITLTFPGIAALVLTIGMAVDTNVLIFERIKEEFKTGIQKIVVFGAGFKNAMSTIVDANVTTLIASFIMFVFGSGAVQGFAVMLSIGILSSMFSAGTLLRILVMSRA